MSFLVVAALAVGLLITVPLAAHLLRRGRADEREFPPTALVPQQPPIARRRSRLEDRVLLCLRVLIVTALAVLGATPLVRCSRLSLARQSGASVALAIVLDDSLSMRAVTSRGESRWALALAGARDLLRSAREGDAVAIVMAGQPARLALAATTDLSAARRTLNELKPSDRPTDLGGAVQIARSALKQLRHVDKRVALLSDLADKSLPAGQPRVWVPLTILREPVANCGIVTAELRARRVTATVACSSAAAARGRRLELVVTDRGKSTKPTPDAEAGGQAASDGVLLEAGLVARAGKQTVAVQSDAPLAELDARLKGKDAIARDDVAPVTPESSALSLAVVVDPTTASVTTGGATVLEQALASLESGAAVRPLTLIPDDAKELKSYAAIILDDPPGLHAESRLALTSWVERGGVAVALLGPRAQSAQLGSTLEPFARGAVRWQETTKAKGIDPASSSWLGSEASSLAELAPRGRAELDGAQMPGARVAARWDDGRPWILERKLGRGLILTVGLPAAVSLSDFALRPGFLSLLDHTIALGVQRAGPRRSVAGSTWLFPMTGSVEIRGPSGPVQLRQWVATASDTGERLTPQRAAVAALAGRYIVKLEEQTQLRVVTIDENEITRQPLEVDGSTAQLAEGGLSSRVDASAELAMVVLLLCAAELMLRLFSRARRRTRTVA